MYTVFFLLKIAFCFMLCLFAGAASAGRDGSAIPGFTCCAVFCCFCVLCQIHHYVEMLFNRINERHREDG